MPTSIRLLDVGCGTGRNLLPFLREEFQVFAVDLDVDALDTARSLYAQVSSTPGPFFVTANAGKLPFRSEIFETALCFDLLHWARDFREFESWWREIWRTLKPGGVFCARFRCRSVSSAKRLKNAVQQRWFLATPDSIKALVNHLGGEWVEPWKVTPIKGGGVQGTVWARRKI